MRQLTKVGAIMLVAALAGCKGESGPSTPSVAMLSPPNAADYSPTFSPDGSHVAYVAQRPHDYAITIADSDLSHPVAVDSSTIWNSPIVWSPDGTRVAYTIGADLDIWTAALAGGSPQHLTTGKGIEFAVQWQPGGTWLTYAATGKSGVGTYQVNVNTGVSMPVPAPAQLTFPFRSPDGSRIAYQVVAGEKSTLWVADSLGENARQLTTEGFESFAGRPATPWSPDGSELLYESARTGMPDVWVLRIADDSARQLTRDVRADDDAVWSPDGKWVAFLSDRGQQTDVWIIPAAGGTPRRVTDNAAQESDLQWIGQRNALAFTTGTQQSGLWTRSLASGAERRLTPDSMRVGGAWKVSPDGKSVVFVALRGGGVRDLQLLDLATGTRRTLVANGAQNMNPLWSPDGSRIAYTSTRTGNRDVWVVDTAGGPPRALTSWTSQEDPMAWSPDGSSIYFTSSHESKPLRDLWEVPAAGGEPKQLTHIGTVGPATVSPATGDVFLVAIGGSQGQQVLDRLEPDDSLQTLWDQTNVLQIPAVSPSGDSIAVLVGAPGGGSMTMLLPAHGGQGREILSPRGAAGAPPDALVQGWSSDGTRIVFGAGGSIQDLYVLTLRDSSVQRLTDTPTDEGGRAFFLAGDTSVIFYRSSDESRIAAVDVGGLMVAKH